VAVLTRDLAVSRAAAEHPERVALVVGGVPFTYAALADRVRRIVTWLDAQGSPSRVALVPRLDLASVCILHAFVERGTTAILLHPRLTAVERAELAADAEPDLVIDDAARAFDEALRCVPYEGPAATPDDEACLAVIYTSGTTGRSKGAMLSRRAFLASAEASAKNLGWEDDDRWLLCMPLAHVGGLSILVRAVLARRCVVVPESDRFDPELFRRVVTRDRVTIASLVPTQLARVLETERRGLPAHVRVVMLGGAASSAGILDAARELAIPALTTYGLTEACSQVTTQVYGTAPSALQGSGPPIAGTEVRIVEARVEVRGPTLMSGYHGTVHASPIGPDGWLRTEDFGRIDEEGRLHLLGRKQELLVTGGENVYPLEVERVLESLPGIAASCVFGTADETWGEIVCAAIVLRPGAGDPLPTLGEELRERLAAHKRPRRIAIVSELAATAAGKLDRRGTAEAAMPLLVPIRT